jgi:serine/threonine protein kinase
MNDDRSASTNTDSILGRTVVELGLATPEEVTECRKLQADAGEESAGQTLGHYLVAHGVLTQRQLDRAAKVVDSKKSDQQIPGYQLLDKLGAGAMATVFKAKQISLDRVVAIKVLPKKYMSDPQFIQRFYAEGRAAAKLNHPNIVQAIDVGQAGDYHYFVMEYVEGESVYEQLQARGRYTEADALETVIAIAEALDHVHSKGMMHRDVKPKNIMITRSGVPKLADMGLARQVTDAEAAQAEKGKAYGTPYYIAPEQIRGELDIDFRADIYGLGATFFHMVTGRVPFDGPTPSAVMHKHLKEPLTPPDHINEELSAGASEIIEVMMAKKREKRYASTSDLLEDLRSVQKGEPPLQARRTFEVSSLAELEAGEVLEAEPVDVAPLFEQPMFWVAMVSILVNILLVVYLIVQ